TRRSADLDAMLSQVAKIAMKTEVVAHSIAFPGLNALQFTNTPNTGVVFLPLDPASERGRSAAEINAEINRKIAGLQEGFAFSLMPPPILGLRSEEHTSELQSRENLVCRLLLEKKKKIT